MDTIIVNGLIGFWLVAFGAMAIFPFVLGGHPDRRQGSVPMEDQVISVRPAPFDGHQLGAPIEAPVMIEPDNDRRYAA